MKLKRIIFSDLIFLLIILLLAMLSIFSYQRINDLNEQSDFITHTDRVKLKLEQILFYVNDAERGQREFLLTGDTAHLDPYFEAIAKQAAALSDMDSLLTGNMEQLTNAKKLRVLVDKRLKKLSAVMVDFNVNAASVKNILTEGRLLTNEVKTLVNNMLDIEEQMLKEYVAENDEAKIITPLYSLILSVFAVFAVALTYFFLRSETRLRFNAEDSIKKLNDYFKDLPAAFAVVKGPTHVHEMSNTAFHEITGDDQMVGKTVLEVLPGEIGKAFNEKLNKVFTEGKPLADREVLLADHYSEEAKHRYYNFVYQPLLNTEGELNGILVFGYEVTEMIEARLKLADAERRTRLAIEAANIGTYDWNLEKKKFVSSPRLIEIFGFKGLKDVTHQQLIDSYHPADRPIRNRAVAKSFKSGGMVYEARIIQPHGAVRWINVYGKIIYDEARTPLRMYGTVLDFTEQKLLLEELKQSEAQFRLLSDSMPQFVWTTTPDGMLNYFNKALVEFCGITEKEIDNDDWLSMLHPDDRKGNLKHWQNSLATGEQFVYEHRLKTREGDYRWYLSRASPQKSIEDLLQRWVGTSTDIQNQKDNSERLELLVKERTKEIVSLNEYLRIKNNVFAQGEENALIGSYSWNLKTGSLEYSDNLYRLFGYEPGDFSPSFEKFVSMIHPADREQVIKDGEESIEKEMLVVHIYRVITKQGATKYFRSGGKIIGKGENVMMIGTVQDVSQEILNSELMQSKNLELERINAELESFNYIASHDLQEPLRKIQAFTQRILSKEGKNFSAFVADYFNRIQSSAARMQSLIEALLSYSRANAMDTKLQSTDLNLLLADVLNDLQETIENDGAIIKYDKLPEIEIIYMQAHQLFTNLITNGIKYRKQGINPAINITSTLMPGKELLLKNESVDQETNYWCISVADNGIGFEQQYEYKIFELFQRLHGNTEYHGTGIGLAICKKIMHNHKGFITAVGKPDDGATFTVYFPQ